MLKTNSWIKAFTLMAVVAGSVSPIRIALAASNPSLPVFSQFVHSVTNGQANVVTGVYVPGHFAFPVVSQPANDPGYVSEKDGVVTRFNMAADNQVIGLLAHNNLAGATFSSLSDGDEIRIVYGDGTFMSYWISRISAYQALEPEDMNSQFYDSATDRLYTANQMFNMFYTGNDHVVLQTCIARGNEASWGRLFITALPFRYSTLLPSDMMSFFFKAWPTVLEANN